MRLEQSFEVRAPVQTVWETLTDVPRVAPCLPGAEITEARDDGTYEGNFKVKLGPTTAAYTGRLSMEDLDESARRATMKANGRDRRGQGSANATIVSTIHRAGDTTRVDVETDFTITGRLARFGRGGMIEDISSRLLRDFAECLQKRLEPEPADVPSPTAGRPPTASPGPAPAALGEEGREPPAPAAQPTGTPRAGTAEAGEAPPEAGAAPPEASDATSPGRAPPSPAKPVSGLSLFFSVLVERIRRFWARRRS